MTDPVQNKVWMQACSYRRTYFTQKNRLSAQFHGIGGVLPDIVLPVFIHPLNSRAEKILIRPPVPLLAISIEFCEEIWLLDSIHQDSHALSHRQEWYSFLLQVQYRSCFESCFHCVTVVV